MILRPIRHYLLRQAANGFVKATRTPTLRTPADAGLDFESVTFEAMDGVSLKGWFMPSDDSKRTVVCNHFLGANKSGIEAARASGNVAVDFIPKYKQLVDAGYNVLAYDLRNHGESAEFNEGYLGMGTTESQDVVGAVRYARQRFPDHELFLNSLCYGCVSTMHAMDQYPNEFTDIKAMVATQPLSADAFVEGFSKRFHISHDDNIAYFSDQLKENTGYEVDALKMPPIADSVSVPTLLVQVHDDWMTTVEDIESIYANLGTDDKKLHWIEGTDKRLEGYNYFGQQPQEMIAWFDAH